MLGRMNTATGADGPNLAERRRFPIRFSAGLVVGVLFLALVALIAVGVVLSRARGDANAPPSTTIAALRADPEGWDGRSVVLRGTIDDVRTIPYLDQYAIFTIRDATGSMRVLSRNGAPSVDGSTAVDLRGVFHSRVQLDAAVQAIIDDQLGGLAGSVAKSLLPDISLDVVFIEHISYAPADESGRRRRE